MKAMRTGIWAAAALIVGTWAFAGAPADPVKLDIASQPLVDALNRFADQTGLQVLVNTDEVAAARILAPEVRGQFTPSEGLKRLLEKTGLTFEFVNERTVRIAPISPPAAAVTERNAIRLTQISGAEPLSERPGAESGSDVPASSPDGNGSERLEEIIVTGTHIRGSNPVGSPLTVIDRAEIERSGAATLAQFFKKLPQNFAGMDGETFLNRGNSGFGAEATGNFTRGSAINLRGLGAAATLVLVNGHRIAPSGSDGSFADISLIPMDAVDRIEILGDGASAIYGADAVAGVVNFILRRDYSGAQTSASYGATTKEGVSEWRVAQTLGLTGGGGGALASFEHYDTSALHAADRGFVPDTGGPFDLIPKTKRNSAYLTGHRQFSNGLEGAADAYYSKREYAQHSIDPFLTPGYETGSAEQHGGSLALTYRRSDWQGDLTAGYSRARQRDDFELFDFQLGWGATTKYFDLKADGPLMMFPAGAVRASVGTSLRREQFSSDGEFKLSRNVHSAYAEVLVPLLETLQLSVAGRYDHYQNMGGSVDPKLGLSWAPRPDVAFRASYARSFRVPTLSQVNPDGQSYFTRRLDNSADPGGTVTIFTASAQNPDLQPERARSFSLGIDIKPVTRPGLSASVTYFNVRFSDRIATPPVVGDPFDVFSQLDVLSPFVDQNPAADEVARIFSEPLFFNPDGFEPSEIEAIIDFRPQNIGLTRTSGVELSMEQELSAGADRFSFSLGGSYLFELSSRPLSHTASIDLVNKIYNPMDLRLRGGASWTRGAVTTSLNLNYSDGYQNNLLTPSVSVDSWLTADLQVGLHVRNITAALNLQNITDEDPPYVAGSGDPFLIPLGFDASNASPLGRMLSLSLGMTW